MVKKIVMDIQFKSGECEVKMIAKASLEEISEWIEKGKVLILKDNQDTEFIINFGAVEKIELKHMEEPEDGE